MLKQRRAVRLVAFLSGRTRAFCTGFRTLPPTLSLKNPKLFFMTTSDQENAERKLNHVLDMGKIIIDNYPHITCTERAALLLAMTAAVRQVTANMRTIAALLRKNLLDPFHINYIEYARKMENLYKIWQEELKGAPVVHNLDNSSRPITGHNDIALKEDTDYDLTIRTEKQEKFDFFETRVGLMDNTPRMCNIVEEGLAQIAKTLREIVDDYLLLKADSNKQDERLRELENQYEEMMWKEDQQRFISEVEEYTLVSGDKDKSTYERYRTRMDREATDPHDIKVLAELNEWFLANQRPAAFIVENRDKLTIEDVARHFCYVHTRNLISQHVESFDLLMPADAEYKDLFVNHASQELAFLLASTIGRYVDFRHNYQYAGLQMALQDLGLIFNDRNNGIQMKEFINRAFLTKGEEIKDQTTLTQWTGKLLGTMFGTMDEQHLNGNYSLKDFEKIKEYYWQCLSIINKVVQIDLKELHFAHYLQDEHEKTPNINDYRSKDGQIIMERLATLKSAIKGETLFS